MAFPNLLKRLFDTDGAGVKLRGNIMPYSTAAPKAGGTASAGTSNTVARGDHVHPEQASVSGNSGTATKLKTKRTIDGVQFDGSANVTHYAVCSTTAGTAAKTATINGFTLATGAAVKIFFSNANTAANPTLNISGTGAKAIRYRNSAIPGDCLSANGTYEFLYDGACWQLVGFAENSLDGASLLNNDLNNLTAAGKYFIQTTAGTTKNPPVDVTAGWWVTVSVHGAGADRHILQEARMHSTDISNAASGTAHVLARCCSNTTWGPWQYPYAQFAG